MWLWFSIVPIYPSLFTHNNKFNVVLVSFSPLQKACANAELGFLLVELWGVNERIYVGVLSPWKWVPGISPRVKAASAYGWRPTTLVVPNVKKIQGLNLSGTAWATSACCGMTKKVLDVRILVKHCETWPYRCSCYPPPVIISLNTPRHWLHWLSDDWITWMDGWNDSCFTTVRDHFWPLKHLRFFDWHYASLLNAASSAS